MSSPSLSSGSTVDRSYRGPQESPWAWPFWIPALVFLAALLVGCATPQPIFRLQPHSKDVIWVGGRASLQQEAAGLRVAAAFEHQDGDRLDLRVEVQNAGDGRIEVDPADIWYSACVSTHVASCTSSLRIIDPERVLAALDEKESRDTAAAANSQAALGTLVLLSAAADIAQVASGHANPSTGALTATTAQIAASDAVQRDSELASIPVQRQLWSNQALRRNTLMPGQGVAGDIFIPIHPSANYVWLQVRVGGQKFSFHFEQTVTKPDPYGDRPSRTHVANR